jgi:hypothetical protein
MQTAFETAFGIVLFGVVAVGAIVALASLSGRNRLYENIGRGAMSMHHDPGRGAGGPPAGSAGAVAERDEEIRQLVAARNEHRLRRGEPALDVEAELARLTAPAIDPALAAEVRSLVIARNERRARAGREPLDVEVEVARQLRELGGGAGGHGGEASPHGDEASPRGDEGGPHDGEGGA